ncbi:hypothetical protein F5B22DRAFT_586905 [Xylaria bambusicola]|uniref:uncharacterized protein n=1 Tax=Xylaria bambusicola TaxID=326684 RepID=UPI002007D902|nr:uncharacterized protein F5B22DRAFT_586905 [Xylaria bambusicola]KAI0526655.1 hypothetical protein F5B22DRAFT_586905 [Xylaria bambusicola]
MLILIAACLVFLISLQETFQCLVSERLEYAGDLVVNTALGHIYSSKPDIIALQMQLINSCMSHAQQRLQLMDHMHHQDE